MPDRHRLYFGPDGGEFAGIPKPVPILLEIDTGMQIVRKGLLFDKPGQRVSVETIPSDYAGLVIERYKETLLHLSPNGVLIDASAMISRKPTLRQGVTQLAADQEVNIEIGMPWRYHTDEAEVTTSLITSVRVVEGYVGIAELGDETSFPPDRRYELLGRAFERLNGLSIEECAQLVGGMTLAATELNPDQFKA